MKYTYLLVLLFTILVPFLFSFHPRIRFDRHFIPFIKASVLPSIPFLAWDVFFTETGVWSFNPGYTIGVKIYNLPIEEVLFFICIPFACVFTIHCFSTIFHDPNTTGMEKILVLLLSSTLLIIGVLFFTLYILL
jgi:lycopene cyclase domain-containing protein